MNEREQLINYWEQFELAYDDYCRPDKSKVTDTIAALRQQQGEQITYDGTQLADLLATSPEAIQNRFEFADKTWSPWMTITVDEAGYCQYANVRHQLRGLYLPQQAEDKPKRGRDFWIAAKP